MRQEYLYKTQNNKSGDNNEYLYYIDINTSNT